MKRVVIIAVLLTTSAVGQVIKIAGGDSTILDGFGAEANLYFPSNTAMVSGGVANGRAGFGLGDAFKFHGFAVTAGDHGFSGMLDGLGGVSLQERGVFAERAGLGFFVGSTGVGETLPFFQTTVAQHVGLGITYHHRFGKWKLSTVDALSGGTHTAAGSAAFNSARLKFTVAGGLLISQPIAAGTLDFAPIKGLRLLASRQNMEYAGVSAVTNSAGLYAGTAQFSANAGAFSGVSAGKAVTGVNAGISASIGPFRAVSGWYATAHQQPLLFSSLTETARHWSLTQTVSESAGRTNFSAGGSYHSNHGSVSVNQSVGFDPYAARGFVKTTSITLTLRIPHSDAGVTLAGTTIPGAGTRYSAYGQDFTKGPYAGNASVGGHHQNHTGGKGKMVIKGRVKDTHGLPVEGAAVALAAVVCYSDSGGDFSLRTNSTKALTVTVLPEDFVVPGQWKVIRAPEMATADALVEVTIEREQ